MEENKEGLLSSFRKKFFATRIAVESILFDGEKKKEEKKDYKAYLYFLSIVFAYILLNLLKHSRELLTLESWKKIEYLNHYLSADIKTILTVSDVSFLNLDMPLYYILHIPLINIFNLNPISSIFIVNSFLILLSTIGIYLTVYDNRNKKAAFTSVIIFLSMPFVYEVYHNFSPVLLTITLVIWSYYLYIKSEINLKTSFIPLFVITVSAGFLSDKFFVFYIIPLLGYINYLFLTVYSHYIVKFLIPSIIISFIFYIRFIVLKIIAHILTPLEIPFFNFALPLNQLINSISLIYFIILFIFFILTITSPYIVYEPRKILNKLFYYPIFIYIIFPIFEKKFLYPTIVPFIILSSISIIPLIRKYFLYAVSFITIIFIFSILPEVKYKNKLLIGFNSKKEELIIIRNIFASLNENLKINDILIEALKNIKKENIVVNIDLEKDFINYYSLNNLKEKYGIENVRFVKYPSFLLNFADYIITDKEQYNLENFKEISKIKNIKILKKNIFLNFEKEITEPAGIKELKINGIKMEDIKISFFDYNTLSKTYKYAIIRVGYSNIYGADIYGITLKLEDVRVSNSPTIIESFSKINVLSAKISDFSLAKAIENRFKLKNLEVEFSNEIIRSEFQINNKTIVIYFSFNYLGNTILLGTEYIKIGTHSIPKFLCRFLKFKYDFNNSNIPISFNDIVFGEKIIYIK